MLILSELSASYTPFPLVMAGWPQQGTHCTGKTGKMAKKNPCQGKHREFGNFAKTQGICFSLVVTSLILKVKDILIFTAEISMKFCICNSHKSRKLAQGKFAVGKGKNTENTGNLKMQFEWVPCRGHTPLAHGGER